MKQSIEKFEGMERYGDFKKEIIEVVLETLRPIQKKYEELEKSGFVDVVLNKGKVRVNGIATEKCEEVFKMVGFGR